MCSNYWAECALVKHMVGNPERLASAASGNVYALRGATDCDKSAMSQEIGSPLIPNDYRSTAEVYDTVRPEANFCWLTLARFPSRPANITQSQTENTTND